MSLGHETMTEEVKQAFSRCVSLAFSDDSWRFWGLKRPKHGSFWDKFRPAWRVDLETKLFAELIITNAAAYVAGGVLDTDGVDELARFLTRYPGVGACIGYSSYTRLTEDILEYAEAPVDDWPSILTARLQIDSIADKKLAASVLVGCAQFSRVASIMIDQVKQIDGDDGYVHRELSVQPNRRGAACRLAIFAVTVISNHVKYLALAGGCILAQLIHGLLWLVLSTAAWVVLLTLFSVQSRNFRRYLSNMGKDVHTATDGDIVTYLALEVVALGAFAVGGASIARYLF